MSLIWVPLTHMMLCARVLSDRYSYAVAMSTLGAFNLAAALVFLTCPARGSREDRAYAQGMHPLRARPYEYMPAYAKCRKGHKLHEARGRYPV